MQRKSEKVEFANTLRGLAALFVILAHYFGVFWTGREAVSQLIFAPPLPTDYGMPIYVAAIQPFSPLNYGSLGVSLFFLISGFVIPFSLERASALEFAINRFFRLTPVYVVGFSITLGSIWFSTRYFGSAWPFTLSEMLAHWLPGMRDVFWSRPIDGIAWTLEIEVKFYLICAIGAALIRRQSIFIFLIPVALAIGSHLMFINLSAIEASGTELYRLAYIFCFAAPFLVYMFIGTAIHMLYKGALDAERALAVISVLFMLFAWLMNSDMQSQLFVMTWTYGVAAVIFFGAYALRERFAKTRITSFFANISYPLYVIHGVFGYVLMRVLVGNGFRASLSLLSATAASVAMAWAVHRLIERPSIAAGKYCGNIIARGRGNQSPEPYPAAEAA